VTFAAGANPQFAVH